MHSDHIDLRVQNAVNAAREEMFRNTREAAKLVKLTVALGCNLPEKKITLIKLLREQQHIDLRAAKEAVELAMELAAA